MHDGNLSWRNRVKSERLAFKSIQFFPSCFFVLSLRSPLCDRQRSLDHKGETKHGSHGGVSQRNHKREARLLLSHLARSAAALKSTTFPWRILRLRASANFLSAKSAAACHARVCHSTLALFFGSQLSQTRQFKPGSSTAGVCTVFMGSLSFFLGSRG
jgi:hypothetical protein